MPKSNKKSKGKSSDDSRQKRKDNFTDEEIEVLVKEVVARKGTIQDPISASLTHAMKLAAWNNIADAVNAVSGIHRTVKETRTKLTNLKSKAKKNYHDRKRAMGQTGGGPPPTDLPLWEGLLLDFIGEEALIGKEGGLETMSGFSQTAKQRLSSSNSSSESFPPTSETEALETLPSLATGRQVLHDALNGKYLVDNIH